MAVKWVGTHKDCDKTDVKEVRPDREAIHIESQTGQLDCFVALLLAMTKREALTPSHHTAC
jgi:hypothetical protein